MTEAGVRFERWSLFAAAMLGVALTLTCLFTEPGDSFMIAIGSASAVLDASAWLAFGLTFSARYRARIASR